MEVACSWEAATEEGEGVERMGVDTVTQTRRTHRGVYTCATPEENGLLEKAFPLGEQLQHAADAFLHERRRYHCPERVRAVMHAREEATHTLSKKVRSRPHAHLP